MCHSRLQSWNVSLSPYTNTPSPKSAADRRRMISDYRQLVFSNVVNGMKLIIDAMDEWEMSVESHNRVRITISHYIRHQPTHSRT